MRNHLLISVLVCVSMAIAADDATLPLPTTGDEGITTASAKAAGPGIINRDPAKAISELGDLYYPGARIMNSLVCYGGGPEDVMVLMSTTDSLDKVKDYYNPKFTGSEVTHTEGPRYYSLLRPERAVNKIGVPPAYITMLQDYSGKEVIITVFQGYCAYEHFNRTAGTPFVPMEGSSGQKGDTDW